MATAKRTAPSEPRPFERVWQIVLRIPRGRVATYGQISRMIEQRLTPIAIGWALRAVPDGALPWHRVVNASGSVSTEREHPGRQRALLEAEGIRFDARGCIDLERFGWQPRRERRATKRATKTAKKRATKTAARSSD